jgi:hypothetical protein
MWTYILGPFLAILPLRWRKSLACYEAVNWARAGVLSGFAEFAVALYCALYWYSYSMTTWVNRGLSFALSGKAGPVEITDQAIGFMAYFIWVQHPLTWLLGYFLVEAAARLCGAAFTSSFLGTLPLFVLDKIYLKIFRRDLPRDAVAVNAPAGTFASAMRDKVLMARLRTVSDELSVEKSGGEELLHVHSCRPKADWTPPRVVRLDDEYYRLEFCSRGMGARPFRYTLRRLPAGVPGRTVLVYVPE